MFPDAKTCFARSCIAEHQAQRATDMILAQDRSGVAEPLLGLSVRITLRGVPGGQFEAMAYCENNGAATLYCAMEGGAGGFTVKPAKGGAVLAKVNGAGMGFEKLGGFETLDPNRGDNRSFLLQPMLGCR
ncbi:MAG: hypothetical protein C0524_11375 [Rhodobacter sp.]|nr:hypothetical protein [Rhodobacter sp.]